MTLILILIVPVAAGLLGWLLSRFGSLWARLCALAGCLAELALLIPFALRSGAVPGGGRLIADVSLPWIDAFGIRFRLSLDGLSLVLCLLTAFLGLVAVLCSWNEIRGRTGFFHMNLMTVLTGIFGVFLAGDLFLFAVFWEFMLIPMYFLIDLWGHEDRHRASVKFFLYTQASGLLMIVSAVVLYLIHGNATGAYTFDLQSLAGTVLSRPVSLWLMLGFFAAFAVKLPVVPFHTWLPDAHTQAPTAGSVVLAGLMLKTGAYGMIRIVLPLFPDASRLASPVFMGLGAAGVVYGAFQAFGQRDLKRLIAYSSVSHLGFVLLGIFSMSTWGYQGAVVAMLAHGFSTGALFVFAGLLQERTGTRDLGSMGGFWTTAPVMGGLLFVFALASLGLPGLGNFVGEFLVFVGAWRKSPAAVAVAVAGLVPATVYGLSLVGRTFFGTRGTVPREGALRDLGVREAFIVGLMLVLLVWLGLFPQSVLDLSLAPESPVAVFQAGGVR